MALESNIGNLEEEALKRKERLKLLRNKAKGKKNEEKESADDKEELPKPVFRSYQPQDTVLKENILPKTKPESVEEEVQDHIAAGNPEPLINEVDLSSLAPRKPDWDLKRDAAKKLEKLQRRTLIGFLTSIGNRNQRIGKSLEYMFCPVVHGTLSSILGVMMLAFSEFDFIVRYFFYVLLALMILGSLNGLLFFPILLSILGPPGEIIPHDDPNRISTPTPEPSPLCERIQRSRPFKRRIYPRINSEISLSTISEEQGSCHSSHEIIVEPEVVVETTTVTNTQGTVNSTTSSKYAPTQERSQSQCSSSEFETSSCSSPSSTTSDCPSLKTQTSITTRVKATAKVKVEVHTPLPGATERENSFRHKRHRRSSYSE